MNQNRRSHPTDSSIQNLYAEYCCGVKIGDAIKTTTAKGSEKSGIVSDFTTKRRLKMIALANDGNTPIEYPVPRGLQVKKLTYDTQKELLELIGSLMADPESETSQETKRKFIEILQTERDRPSMSPEDRKCFNELINGILSSIPS